MILRLVRRRIGEEKCWNWNQMSGETRSSWHLPAICGVWTLLLFLPLPRARSHRYSLWRKRGRPPGSKNKKKMVETSKTFQSKLWTWPRSARSGSLERKRNFSCRCQLDRRAPAPVPCVSERCHHTVVFGSHYDRMGLQGWWNLFREQRRQEQQQEEDLFRYPLRRLYWGHC